jgi:hypothetical protein
MRDFRAGENLIGYVRTTPPMTPVCCVVQISSLAANLGNSLELLIALTPGLPPRKNHGSTGNQCEHNRWVFWGIDTSTLSKNRMGEAQRHQGESGHN